ncbi:hypothetical protein [Nitrosomonas sp.]|uniref:hypothetical protein n=1 Tax=Nitrosomonas sp. TaxID=42353 RepID=UPI0033059526
MSISRIHGTSALLGVFGLTFNGKPDGQAASGNGGRGQSGQRTLGQLYRNRADAENTFDELKNQ